MYTEIWSQLWGEKKYIVPVLRHDLLMTPWQWRHTEENPRKKMINIEIDSEKKQKHNELCHYIEITTSRCSVSYKNLLQSIQLYTPEP